MQTGSDKDIRKDHNFLYKKPDILFFSYPQYECILSHQLCISKYVTIMKIKTVFFLSEKIYEK